VLAGQTAPTMTDAANYGRTGAVDLLAVLAGTRPAWAAPTRTTPAVGRRVSARRGGGSGAAGTVEDEWRQRQARFFPDDWRG
jgi:hypothetical protein